MMVKVGQKVRFDPLDYISGMGAEAVRGTEVTGTVVMVNVPHKWFLVEDNKTKLRASYKFCDIGEAVTIIG